MIQSRIRKIFASLVLPALLAAGCSRDPEVAKREHFESGNKYFAEERFAEAIIEYRNAIQLDPRYGEAYFKLAEAFVKTENVEAAYPAYIRAADALPDDRPAQMSALGILLLAGQFEDVKARATAWLGKHPTDVEVLLMRANAMAALKDPDGALAEIEEALKLEPGESRTYINLGAVQLRKGETKEAEAAFRQGISLAPMAAEPHLALANYLLSVNRREEAEASIKEALAVQPDNLLANRMLAGFYIATQRVAEAEAPLKAMARLANDKNSQLTLADYYTRTRRLDEARALLTKLAEDPAAFADAELRLAQIDYAEKRVEQAHERLNGILGRAPRSAPVLETRARWLAAENKLDEALESATAAVAAAPQSATAHYALAVVRDRRRDVPEAIASYNEVLRLNPRAAAAQVQLSRLSLATGDREAAVRFAEGASRTAPGAGEVRLALARSLLARGDLARATPEIAALLKQFPDNASVQSLEGALQMARGNTAGARTAFERALAAAPGMTEPIGGLTALDIRAKQPSAAVARLEAALRESPQNPALLALAAQAYGASGDLAKTEQSLRRAVEIDPRFTPGYAMLAQLYLAQKRLDQARGEFEGMVKRDPQNVQARTMVGVLLEAENKPAEARKWYEETVAITDRAPIVANNLAFMYAESGTNLDQALQLAQTAKQLLPESPDVDDTLGWVYYKKDQAALAVRPLESSVEKNPKNVMYLYHLGLAYAKAGNPVKARDMLQRALELDPTFAGADEARRTLDSLRG